MEWADAHVNIEYDGGLEDVPTDLVVMRDIGFLVKKTKKLVVLLASITDIDDTGRTMTTIPLSQVLRITLLQPEVELFTSKDLKNEQNVPESAVGQSSDASD